MANQLKMAIVTSIPTLYKRGWSQRKIARELGVSRTTVRRHLAGDGPQSNCTTNPAPRGQSETIGGHNIHFYIDTFPGVGSHSSGRAGGVVD